METEAAVIHFVTRCASAEEFIERFARFATETDIVVPALQDVDVGSERHFAICLKDGSIVMKGRCEVAEVRPAAVAPGAAGPALMRLHLREMDAHSCGIHLRLMERRAPQPAEGEARADEAAAPAPVTPPAPASTTTEVSAVTAVGEPPLASDTETTAISPLPRPETRAPGAKLTLPANPLSDLAASELASFVEITLLESSAQPDQEPTLVSPPAPAARGARRLTGARRTARRAVPYAACVIAGLALGIVVRPGTPPAPVVSAAAATPSPAPEAPETAPPATAPPAPAPEDEPPIVARRDCVARVKTKPAGAEVSWGDIALGSTPIKGAAVPCGTATVTIRRKHYADVTRTITTERGRGAVIAQSLRRPSAKPAVTSSPPNATSKLNKNRLATVAAR